MTMALSRELLFLIRQFCEEEKLEKTAHMLEQETGFFFDMKYFEDLVLCGRWNEAEKYLSGFTGVEDNNYSIKIYFEMRKQKFLEALDKHDVAMALDILMKDLKVFAPSNEEVYLEMTLLLTMDNFRNHPSLSTYGDVISARRQIMNEIKVIIEANPQFHRKLEFPEIEKSRLRRLINQSLNWQHVNCPNRQAEPHIKTLFIDHRCLDQPSNQNPLPTKTPSASLSPLSGKSVAGPSAAPESNVSASTANLGNQSKRAVTLEGINDSGNPSKISSSISVDEMVSLPSVPVQRKNLNSNLHEKFPKSVERSIDMSSSPTSMEFHPVKDTLLLVGKSTGDIELWDIISEAKLFWNAFMIWKREAISVLFLKDLDKDPCISVNRVSWSPDGSVFGAAYSKHIVQLYTYHAKTNYIEKQLEIEAHFGGVNDLAFSSPHDELLVITCGDDKLIQVWDAMTGSKQYTFEGHSDSVYSVCPHVKEDIHFMFSTSTNGEIKAWLFDNTGPKVQYNAPGYSCMRMAYSADGKRLFSCGTNKDGESYIVEWNESEGYITKTFHGLCKPSAGVVQFCTSRNSFLAAGDEHLIKVWDVDSVELLTAIDADGGLPACPYICFNKKGILLAVICDHNKIKILANDVGHQLLQTSTLCSVDSPGFLSESLRRLGINSAVTTRVRAEDGSVLMEENMRTEVPFQLNKVLDTQNKIVEVSRCQSLRLPTELKTNKICRLLYTNSGNGILALTADGIHLLWRWSGNDPNIYGKATTKYTPQLWQPRSGFLMINDLPDDNFPVVSPCIALSKNDSYLVSSSGKTVSLFNTLTFKKMRSCMDPPPAATCLAFYPPDNNIIAIGMDDSTILIYSMRLAQVTHRLRGHLKRISGFAFSNVLKVLISCGVDTQIIVWDSTRWERKNTTLLQISVEWLPSETSETYVQFHQDQKHFLAVHETQLAIYETTTLERVKQWMIGNFCARISHATWSSDNQLVYSVMRDGIILILSASDLSPRFEIDPSIYLPPNISSRVYPLVITAHPMKPNQFALGLSDGGVIIIEPHESEGNWITQPPVGNGSASRTIIA